MTSADNKKVVVNGREYCLAVKHGVWSVTSRTISSNTGKPVGRPKLHEVGVYANKLAALGCWLRTIAKAEKSR